MCIRDRAKIAAEYIDGDTIKDYALTRKTDSYYDQVSRYILYMKETIEMCIRDSDWPGSCHPVLSARYPGRKAYTKIPACPSCAGGCSQGL